MTFVGVDGCKAGWFSVSLNEASWSMAVYPTYRDLWLTFAGARTIFVDIPIGLRDEGTEERKCDKEARRLLRAPRASSVFPAPCRPALNAANHREASDLNNRWTGRGLCRQSWSISRKIREVDDFLQTHTEARGMVRECHPELLFWSLNGGKAMEYNKKEPEGYRVRLAVLTGCYAQAPLIAEEALRRFLRKEVGRDDVLDAFAAAVTAYVTQGSPLTIPETPERDPHGLPMEMVYAPPMPAWAEIGWFLYDNWLLRP